MASKVVGGGGGGGGGGKKRKSSYTANNETGGKLKLLKYTSFLKYSHLKNTVGKGEISSTD